MNKLTYTLLAVITASIGLASSAVTAEFFILGLQRMESDVLARDALIAAGLLMIVTELAAFGLAALLPSAQLRALRGTLVACGLALLTFEAATIYITQATLARNADSQSAGAQTKITQLRASIELQRAAAENLQTNGKVQSQSSNAWTRQVGAKALNQAVELARRIEPLSTELAELESSQLATMKDVIGPEGVIWYSVARAMLISIMGLVMFGASGALVRARRGVNLRPTPAQDLPPAPQDQKIEPVLNPIPAGFKPAWPSVAWAIPATAVAAITSPAAAVQVFNPVAAPDSEATETEAKIETSPEIQVSISEIEAPRLKIEPPSLKIEPEATPKIEPAPDKIEIVLDRYGRVREAVQAGTVKPSVLAVKGLEKIGGEAAMALLVRMEAEGVTVRRGRVWSLPS